MSVTVYDAQGNIVPAGVFTRIMARFGIGGLRLSRGIQTAGPGTYPTPAASPVTFDSAMQVSAFWACVRLIVENVASLPLYIYRIDNGRKVREDRHPLYNLLLYRPNRWQTSVEFWEAVVLQLAVHGNAFVRVWRRPDGSIFQMAPVMFVDVEVLILEDGTLVYKFGRPGGVEVLSPQSLWHIKLFGNGLMGLSPLDHARNALSIAQAAEASVTRTYANGAKPAGLLTIDRVLTDKQRDEVRRNFAELAEGTSDNLWVLEAGYQYQKISLSPQDIELLATRKYQVEDICRFMGVPSVLVNDMNAATVWGTGIQQIINGWYKLGLRPYLNRIEVSGARHLLSPQEQTRYILEFDLDALLRADRGARIEQGRVAVGGGLQTANEWRKDEGLDPVEGGDTLLVNGTMVPIASAAAGRPQTQAGGSTDNAPQIAPA